VKRFEKTQEGLPDDERTTFGPRSSGVPGVPRMTVTVMDDNDVVVDPEETGQGAEEVFPAKMVEAQAARDMARMQREGMG
jgi:hypothetical protein